MNKRRDWVLNLPPGLATPRPGFAWRDPRVDALMDSYVEWREESATVESAYERWGESERSERALAYAAYRAALDREEHAAAVCQLAATRLAGATRELRQA